jgi:hypothetical protein
MPQAGQTFSIKCFKEGFPEVIAQTTVPQVPSIFMDEVRVVGNRIEFSIVADTSAALYDVYLFSGEFVNTTRLLQNENDMVHVSLSFEGVLDTQAYIAIYAYDVNLSSFLTAPNIFIKPNTYRPPFSTVNGGYGCFGSLNLLIWKINRNS